MIKSTEDGVAGMLRQIAPLTVEQYEAMIERGILEEGAPIELIEGLLIRKDRAAAGEDPMTVGPRHANAIAKITRLAGRFERLGHHVRTQSPVRMPPHSEPEPDIAIAKGALEDYPERHPGPRDLACAIEVADSSLRIDRTTKLAVYAEAGLNQYVIVNLVDDEVEVHTDPIPAERRYKTRTVFTGEQPLTLAAGPTKAVKVKAKDLIP
jgi:Uma2 family endonuclease